MYVLTPGKEVYVREGVAKNKPDGTAWTLLLNARPESFISVACEFNRS